RAFGNLGLPPTGEMFMNVMSMLRTRVFSPSSASCLFALLIGSSGCSGGHRNSSIDEQVDTSTARGELVVYMIDHEDGAMDTDYFLRRADGVERKLVFDQDPKL